MAGNPQPNGIAATLAILAAAGSYFTTCGGYPGWGLLLSLVSVPLGVIGLVMSVSPRVAGARLSIAAIGLGAIGVVVAILGLIGVIGANLF